MNHGFGSGRPTSHLVTVPLARLQALEEMVTDLRDIVEECTFEMNGAVSDFEAELKGIIER